MFNLKGRSLNFCNFLLIVGLILIQLSYICENVVYLQNSLSLIKFIGLASLSIKIFLSLKFYKIDKIKLLTLFICFVSSVIIYIKFSKTLFLEILIFSLAFLNENFDKTIKKDLIIKILCLLFVVINYYLGLTNGVFESMLRDNVLRLSLGFYHPNTLSMFSMMIIFDFLYLERKKLNFKKNLIVIVFSLLISRISGSRTSLYCVIIILLLISFNKFFKCENIFIAFSHNLYVIFLILSLILTYMYINNSSIAFFINDVISNRIKYQAYFCSNYSINLFGNMIDYDVTLDNGFIKILLNYGIIVTCTYIFLYIRNLKKIKKEDKNNFMLVCIYIVIMIYCLSESYLFFMPFNMYWIYSLCKEKE